jgi:hypothetical protein
MFYIMNQIVLLAATALILTGAIVAIASPNVAEAAPKHQWCWTDIGGEDYCEQKKPNCRASIPSSIANIVSCERKPLS